MTKWFAYFRDKSKLPHFKLITAKDLTVAEMMASELAVRNKSECIGVIVAPQLFQEPR
ncbi:hypothetical protein LCGC14_0801760 [marine sediment metagenome]|uniref:Uncharacterized protein n=1 Tax=marine sediment metagenome TaxID=412755 RepID=A0A0F9SWJ2_9ZZZZ